MQLIIILDATHLCSRFLKNEDKDSSCIWGAATAFKRTGNFGFFKQ
jgi:hypothetical protein